MLGNVEHVMPGVVIYHDVFPQSMNIINRLEEILSKDDDDIKWKPSFTGTSTYDLRYRDCYEYKIKKNTDDPTGKSLKTLALETIWEECYDVQKKSVDSYRKKYNLAPLNYWESFNFVKYGKSQHFGTHSDHGWAYVSVLSLVGYLNDDYEGGELHFPYINYTYKPKAGDLILFPSSYLFSHSANPVTNGTKYAIVTMLDYHEVPHNPEYRGMQDKIKNLFGE